MHGGPPLAAPSQQLDQRGQGRAIEALADVEAH